MAGSDRPFSEVLKSIFGNIEDMIRAEMKLAINQAREEMAKAVRGALWIVLGSASALFAMAFVLVAIFLALLPLVPSWAAALIVAAGVALLSIIALGIGMGMRRSSMTSHPASDIKSAQPEELSWAKQQAR